MGTTWNLYLYEKDSDRAAELSEEVFEEVDRIEALLSNYQEGSELSRINRLAAKEPVVTDPETFRFLERAQYWSRVSDGAFDMTVGALMKAWGFYRKSGRVPTGADVQQLQHVTGWRKMQLDAGDRSITFTASGVELDPGGIGKGFGVDAAIHLLHRAGVKRAMLSAGSSTIATIGSPLGKQGWPILIPDPLGKSDTISTVLLRDTTLSTANCSEKKFTLIHHTYCHIMNPKTLQPVEGVLQVTVLAPSATDSDALSNVLFVETVESSAKLLHTLSETRALVVTAGSARPVCTTLRWDAPVAPGACERRKPYR